MQRTLNDMRVLIRADANPHIGIGHIMRCRSVAQAFEKRGVEVMFVTADHQCDNLLHDFRSICLDSVWNDMMGEINKLAAVINKSKPSLLIVDSYQVSENYFSSLPSINGIAYFDDVNVGSFDVDYVINYNVYGPQVDYSKYGSGTKFLLGMQYAPLRPEFMNMPKHIIKPVSDIFVSAGGTDPEHVIEGMLNRLCPSFPDIHFHFVTSSLNPRLKAIRQVLNGNIVLHIDEMNISALMLECDIAISAAGATLYELCSVGIPTITYILADNQIIGAREFERQGIMLNANDCRNSLDFYGTIKTLLMTMIHNEGVRKEMSERMQKMVDGKGADRIVDALIR